MSLLARRKAASGKPTPGPLPTAVATSTSSPATGNSPPHPEAAITATPSSKLRSRLTALPCATISRPPIKNTSTIPTATSAPAVQSFSPTSLLRTRIYFSPPVNPRNSTNSTATISAISTLLTTSNAVQVVPAGAQSFGAPAYWNGHV